MIYESWPYLKPTFSYSAAIWVRNGVASDIDSKSFKQFMFIRILSWISVGKSTKFKSGWFSFTFMLLSCDFNVSHLSMHLKCSFEANFYWTMTSYHIIRLVIREPKTYSSTAEWEQLSSFMNFVSFCLNWVRIEFSLSRLAKFDDSSITWMNFVWFSQHFLPIQLSCWECK